MFVFLLSCDNLTSLPQAITASVLYFIFLFPFCFKYCFSRESGEGQCVWGGVGGGRCSQTSVHLTFGLPVHFEQVQLRLHGVLFISPSFHLLQKCFYIILELRLENVNKRYSVHYISPFTIGKTWVNLTFFYQLTLLRNIISEKIQQPLFFFITSYIQGIVPDIVGDTEVNKNCPC